MVKHPLPAHDIPAQPSNYPQSFAERVAGRSKRKLGDAFGLSRFGVNLTELAPAAVSAVAHHHSQQDEFIYILEGEATLLLDNTPHAMKAGDCFGFKAGEAVAHQLANRSDAPVRYLEIGDRSEGDVVEYPFDDLQVEPKPNGGWRFSHKNGSPY